MKNKILCLAFALASSLSVAHAQVIFDDTFSASDPITGTEVAGRTPAPTDTGGATWSIQDGTNTIGTGGDNFSNLGSNQPFFNTLAYTGLAPSETYTLSMAFSLSNATGNNWLAFGFVNSNYASAFGSYTDGWMLTSGVNDTNALTYFTTSAMGGTSAGPATFTSGVMSIDLTTDALGAGTLDFYAGSDSSDLSFLGSETLTASQVSAITGVAYFGYGGTDGTISEFKLTASAAPEPSTWAMLLAGAGLLGFLARRRTA